MPVIHKCDSLTNFAADNGTISLSSDLPPSSTNTASLEWVASAYQLWLRLGQRTNLTGNNFLTFPYKASDKSKIHNIILRTDWANFKSYDFTSQLANGVWTLVTIDLAAPTAETGVLNFADIETIIFEVLAFSTPIDDRISQIEAAASASLPPTEPPTEPPLPTDETILYQSDFATTLLPFSVAAGTATLLAAAQDPLLLPSCKLQHNMPVDDRASIAIMTNPDTIAFGGARPNWLVYSSIRIKTSQMRTDTLATTGIAHIRHPELYGGGGLWYAQLQVFNGKLRLSYYDAGTMNNVDFTSGSGLPEANVKEDYELYVKIGNGNGTVTVTKNGIELYSKSTLKNHDLPVTPSGSIGSIEIGTSWGTPNSPVHIYNVTVSGSTFVPLPTITINGHCIDSAGNPLQNVGIRVGKEIDPNIPWNVKTFYKEVYSDAAGNFSFTDDPDKLIPEMRFIKLGYGDPALPIGSVTKKLNIQTPASGSLDLGNITLQTRQPIQAPVFPDGEYWRLRAITIFPFNKAYGSPAFDAQLKLIKQKQLPFNVIQIRTQFVGANVASMDFDTGQYSISSVFAAVDQAHANGFEALVSINSYSGDIGNHLGISTADPAWMTKYKSLIMQVGQMCVDHDVEWFLITFENYLFNGQETAAWMDILNSLRALPNWKTKVGATLNPATSQDYTTWQNSVTADSAFWSMCDIIQYENWYRLSTINDPTEEHISLHWHNTEIWDDYKPDIQQALTYIKTMYPNAKLIMNTAFHNGDGCAIYPWSGSAFTKVVNEEAQALGYRATFNTFQSIPLDGWNMEHYSFDSSTSSVHSSFNGMHCESFIKAGLLAHSTGEPEPEPEPPPTESSFGIIAILAAAILLGIAAFSMKGGD